MNPEIVKILSGVSTLFGLIAIIAYLYTISQENRAERSIRDLVEGDQLFQPDKVVEILKLFADDAGRLQALAQLADVDRTKAEGFLAKIKNNVDVSKIHAESGRQRLVRAAAVGAVMLVLGLIGLIWSLNQPGPGGATTPGGTDSLPVGCPEAGLIRSNPPSKSSVSAGHTLLVDDVYLEVRENCQVSVHIRASARGKFRLPSGGATEAGGAGPWLRFDLKDATGQVFKTLDKEVLSAAVEACGGVTSRARDLGFGTGSQELSLGDLKRVRFIDFGFISEWQPETMTCGPPPPVVVAVGAWPEVQTLTSLTRRLRDESGTNKKILLLALQAGDNGAYVFSVAKSTSLDRGEVVYRGKALAEAALLEVRTMTDINYRISQDVWRAVGPDGAQLLGNLFR